LQNDEMDRTRELNELKHSGEKIEQKITYRKEEIRKRQLTLDSTQEEIDQHERDIEEIQTNMIERLNEVSVIKGKIHRNELQIENNHRRQEHLQSRTLILSQTNLTLEKEIEASKESIIHFEETQKKLLDKKLNIRKQIQKIENENEAAKKELLEKRHVLNKAKSRIEALKDMEDQYDGYFFSVKKIMELNDPGAIGVIAELIDVDKRYEKAIEIALGSGLQNIVTVDENKAKKFIRYLKDNRFGRGTFLPMTTVKGQKATNIRQTKGFIGIASDIIGYDQKFAPIMRQLLGRILIVEDLDSGTELARANQQKYRIITLDGDVISPGGAMSGGAFKKEKGQLLSRKNEIESLSVTIEKDEQYVSELEGQTIKKDDQVMILKEDIESIREQEQELNLELHTVTTLLNGNQTEYERYKNELEELMAENKQLEDETERLGIEKEAYKNHLGTNETTHTDAEDKVRELNEYIQVLKEDREIVQEEITNDKMELSSMMQQAEHVHENIGRLASSLQNKTETRSTLQEEINGLELNNLKEMQELESAKKQQLASKECLLSLNETLSKLRLKRQEIQVSKGQLDSKKDIAHEETSALEKELMRISGQIEKLEILKETQINYIWDEYELTYNRALDYKEDMDLSEAVMKQKISKLKSEMKQLGDVNVHAIEEYRQVKERYIFLSTQQEDLERAKEKLLDIIKDLDHQMTVQFKEKFNEINKTFNRVFIELFGGGKGMLELTDTENVLEAGITIVAQPPGKKLQNMMLLSGGERAFTAIALLFSIQSLRPSPFVVLDEIEAALDDANVDRFAQYLRKLTDQTQFIVITHRKGTMEQADALYGITMQEKGVSTQVSVKLIQDQLENPGA